MSTAQTAVQVAKEGQCASPASTMQFADVSSVKYTPFGYYYGDVMQLVDFIDNPRPKNSSPSFKDKMDFSKRFFPLFHAHCEETDPQLHTMTKEERLGLKLKLLAEVKTMMDETRQAITGEKRLRDIRLPNDPVDCMKALREILNAEGYEKKGMTEYLKDSVLCNFAMGILIHMKVDRDQFLIFNENLFTAMPRSTGGLRRSKRVRKSLDSQ